MVPNLSITNPYLKRYSSVSLKLKASGTRYMSVPTQFTFLDDGEEVVVGADCLFYSVSDFFVRYMVCVVDAKDLSVASHFCCQDSPL